MKGHIQRLEEIQKSFSLPDTNSEAIGTGAVTIGGTIASRSWGPTLRKGLVH